MADGLFFGRVRGPGQAEGHKHEQRLSHGRSNGHAADWALSRSALAQTTRRDRDTTRRALSSHSHPPHPASSQRRRLRPGCTPSSLFPFHSPSCCSHNPHRNGCRCGRPAWCALAWPARCHLLAGLPALRLLARGKLARWQHGRGLAIDRFDSGLVGTRPGSIAYMLTWLPQRGRLFGVLARNSIAQWAAGYLRLLAYTRGL
jgi:hypothetical protein